MILSDSTTVLNAGLPSITEAVPRARVLQLNWRPPAFGDPAAARLMASLQTPAVEAANREAIAAVHAVRPKLVDVRPAREAIGFLASGRRLLHAGPPIAIEDMADPVRGALIGACLLEGWAATPEAAAQLLDSGAVEVAPCHHHHAVGPMAGVVAPSMPVVVVTDPEHTGTRCAYATLNEGLGKALRFGAYDADVLARLRWMGGTLGPVLSEVLHQAGPIDLTALIAQGLTMGDEGHNRVVATTSLLARRLAPVLAGLGARGVEVMRFLADNDHFALNISMASAKLAVDTAAGWPGSTLVTAMARNGVEFGLRVAATGDRWFTAPVGPADGLFFPGYGPADANPDLGDSAITETLGIGGFAMAAAPAITRFVGGTPADALANSIEMARITVSRHPVYQLPALGFVGSPSGIDVLKVLDTGILPLINTGIAHKKAGVGQIGAGVVRAPQEVFLKAIGPLAGAIGGTVDDAGGGGTLP